MRIIIGIAVFIFTSCLSGNNSNNEFLKEQAENNSIPGAWQTQMYFSLLKDKRIAFVGNHTSTIKNTHVIDTLLSSGFNVVKVFSPEHGFRGEAAAGEHISDNRDPKTNLPIISLYGSNRRPNPFHLNDVDIILFDIQDVGTRFYTYISTMTYVMDEAAKQNIPVIILDRPNPLGHFVDGPVLEIEYSSFVGLHPVPIVHGMTIGEYALMVNGMGWLENDLTCNLTVISVANYDHKTYYEPPIAPSPNLPNIRSIYLYPSLCLFEGTPVSIGRGTDYPFQVYGHSGFYNSDYSFSFVPLSKKEAPNPPEVNKVCYGRDLRDLDINKLRKDTLINLEYIIEAYNSYPEKEDFFNSYFNLLAGNSKLQEQIISGLSAAEIRNSWEKKLNKFKEIRREFLLYDDF